MTWPHDSAFQSYTPPSPSPSPTSAAQGVGCAQSIEAALAAVAAGALDVSLAPAGPRDVVTATPVHGSLRTADAACWETGHSGRCATLLCYSTHKDGRATQNIEKKVLQNNST